jgi:hypothetical protein
MFVAAVQKTAFDQKKLGPLSADAVRRMIPGFAHFIYNTANAAKALERWLGGGWSEQFFARSVANPAEKWPLMSKKAAFHDIHLLSGPVAVEVVEHDMGTVDGAARLRFEPGDDMPEIRVRNMEEEAAFFVDALGFTSPASGLLEMNSRFPQWSLKLKVTEDPAAALDPPLDLEGLSCIAFYTTNLENDIARLLDRGGRDKTDTFSFTINDRDLRIAMLRSPEGTIIELIQIV